MRANSPSALFASLSLHFLAAATIVLFSLMVQRAQDAQKPPVIFELVAGPPTSPFEKEAPALGVPEPIKFTAPKVAPAKQPPQPVEEEEEEVDDVPVVKTPPKQPPKQAPKAKDEPKKAPPKVTKDAPPRKVSYEEFKKKHGEPKVAKNSTPRSMAKVPRVDTKGIVGGVKGGSTANDRGGAGGKALTASEVRDQETYEARLIAMLKVAHEKTKPEGLGDSLSAEVVFFLSADGQIRDVQISRSSGNAEFDRSVLAAFRLMTWPGARPDRKSDSLKVVFRMREED
jgi:colicin import membrane protein